MQDHQSSCALFGGCGLTQELWADPPSTAKETNAIPNKRGVPRLKHLALHKIIIERGLTTTLICTMQRTASLRALPRKRNELRCTLSRPAY